MKTNVYHFFFFLILNLLGITLWGSGNSLFSQTQFPVKDTVSFYSPLNEKLKKEVSRNHISLKSNKIKRHKNIRKIFTYLPYGNYDEITMYLYKYDQENEVRLYKEAHPTLPPLEIIRTIDEESNKEFVWYRYHKLGGSKYTIEERKIRTEKIERFRKIKESIYFDSLLNKESTRYIFEFEDGRNVQVYKSPLKGKKPIEVIQTIDNHYYLDCPWYRYSEPEMTNSQKFLELLSEVEGLDSATLNYLPKLKKYKKLTILDIFPGQLKSLPEEISLLEDLILLRVKNNNLVGLPKSLIYLEKLREIRLSGNDFSELPIVLESMPQLETVEFENNNISIIPKWLFNLRNVSVLNLSKNNINTLPKEIEKLKSLSWLNLSGNYISKVPFSIGNIESLHILDISNNNIRELPKSIGNLKGLRILNLSNNNLRKLPESIYALDGYLEKINLSGNNFSDIERRNIMKNLSNCRQILF